MAPCWDFSPRALGFETWISRTQRAVCPGINTRGTDLPVVCTARLTVPRGSQLINKSLLCLSLWPRRPSPGCLYLRNILENRWMLLVRALEAKWCARVRAKSKESEISSEGGRRVQDRNPESGPCSPVLKVCLAVKASTPRTTARHVPLRPEGGAGRCWRRRKDQEASRLSFWVGSCKGPQTGGFNSQNVSCHRSGGQRSKIKVARGHSHGEGCREFLSQAPLPGSGGGWQPLVSLGL